MPVQKSALKASIKKAFVAEMDKTDNTAESLDRIAEVISDAVAKAVVEGVNTAVIALSNSGGPVTGKITASAV